MPRALQVITYVVPARYFLVALRGIVLKGAAARRTWSRRWPRWRSTPLAMLSLASLRLARERA